jgi:hypothetical protein
MGLQVHPRVEKKLHDLETSSFTHYKKKLKIEPSVKKNLLPFPGIVKASCCVNFSPQKQQSTATNTVKLSKNCVKPSNERDQDA